MSDDTADVALLFVGALFHSSSFIILFSYSLVPSVASLRQIVCCLMYDAFFSQDEVSILMSFRLSLMVYFQLAIEQLLWDSPILVTCPAQWTLFFLRSVCTEVNPSLPDPCFTKSLPKRGVGWTPQYLSCLPTDCYLVLNERYGHFIVKQYFLRFLLLIVTS